MVYTEWYYFKSRNRFGLPDNINNNNNNNNNITFLSTTKIVATYGLYGFYMVKFILTKDFLFYFFIKHWSPIVAYI